MLLPLALLALVIALLMLESVVVYRDVARLQRRVHVGGTRGKSSVTRYIAAGLREGGESTWGKITGVRPTLIRHDGTAVRINRRGGARVQEQFRIIRRAVKQGVVNLVLECMSITPELQRLESRFFRPHVFVLTKIRDDHREHLGSGEEQVEAMCSAIPHHSLVITDDLDHRETIDRVAAVRGSRVKYIQTVDDAVVASCPDGAFPINLALALETCVALGADRGVALRGIRREASGEKGQGAVALGSGNTKFVNGFAVNDVESARHFIDYWRSKEPSASGLIVMLNTRSDRPLRSLLFAEWLARLEGLSRVILLGDHAACAARALAEKGLARERISVWRRRQLQDIPQSLRSLGPQDALIVGLGNIGGDGFRVAEALGTPV